MGFFPLRNRGKWINKTVNYVKIEGNASKKTSKPIVQLKTPSGDIINDDLKINALLANVRVVLTNSN